MKLISNFIYIWNWRLTQLVIDHRSMDWSQIIIGWRELNKVFIRNQWGVRERGTRKIKMRLSLRGYHNIVTLFDRTFWLSIEKITLMGQILSKLPWNETAIIKHSLNISQIKGRTKFSLLSSLRNPFTTLPYRNERAFKERIRMYHSKYELSSTKLLKMNYRVASKRYLSKVYRLNPCTPSKMKSKLLE